MDKKEHARRAIFKAVFGCDPEGCHVAIHDSTPVDLLDVCEALLDIGAQVPDGDAMWIHTVGDFIEVASKWMPSTQPDPPRQ